MPRRSMFGYPENSIATEDERDYISMWNFDLRLWIGGLFRFVRFCFRQIHAIVMRMFVIFFSIFGYYFMWIVLHYTAVHLYPRYCAPSTILGFVLSPFMVSALHCIVLRWIVLEGSNVIVSMWVVVGTFAVRCLLRR